MKKNVKTSKNPPKTSVSFELPKPLYGDLKVRAADMGRTISGHLRKLVKDDLKITEAKHARSLQHEHERKKHNEKAIQTRRRAD